MTLRLFHIVFISLCALLALWAGAWSSQTFADGGSSAYLAGAFIGFAAGIALPIYGVYFFKKSKHLTA